MMSYIFRPTTSDFRKWCKEYVNYAFDIVKTYELNPSVTRKKDYEIAKKICRQYKVLLASLEKKERAIFENTIMKNKAIRFSVKEERIAFSIIFENWKEICFPERKHHIKTITKEEVGERITTLRKEKGYTRKYVADIIGINEATLKAYENGDRLLRLDVAYQLTQIYEMTVDELLKKSAKTLKNST